MLLLQGLLDRLLLLPRDHHPLLPVDLRSRGAFGVVETKGGPKKVAC